MTESPCVRPAAPGDAPEIRRVCMAGWHDAYEGLLPDAFIEANVRAFYGVDALRAEIRDPGDSGAWLVAEHDGETVGAGRGTVPERGYCELFNLYVHPDAQGEGVGSVLLGAITERQRATGANCQLVSVYEAHDALGFYRRHGFERLGTHPARAVAGVDPDHVTAWLARDL